MSNKILSILLQVTCLFFPFAAVVAQSHGPKSCDRAGKDHAIFFAVKDYEDSQWSNLRNPIRDAKALSKVLSQYYGFETEIMENPTKLEIQHKIEELQRQEYAKEDQLLLFFSGHGMYKPFEHEEDPGRGYFVPTEGQMLDTSGASYLPYTTLVNAIDKIQCEHIMVAIDACYSGAFLALKGMQRPGENKKCAMVAQVLSRKSRLGITSGGMERTPDGRYHSPFTIGLLEGLNQGGGMDSIITLSGLYGEYMLPQSAIVRKGYFGMNEPGSEFLFIRNLNPEREDDDGDGLPNESDGCPQEPGTNQLGGCPDFDQDGLIDKKDPYPFDPHKTHQGVCGCGYPEVDSDEDGVYDCLDNCPKTPGLKSYDGCPSPKISNEFYTDPRDGQRYRTLTLRGLTWLAENLRYNTTNNESWYYRNDQNKFQEFGLLYTHKAAKKACPPGWRLPSNNEWRAMALAFGGVGQQVGINVNSHPFFNSDSHDNGKTAYQMLKQNGESGFNAALGGTSQIGGKGSRLWGTAGIYWSSDDFSNAYTTSDKALTFILSAEKERIYPDILPREMGASCRCVIDQ